jgi:hypothetical protein
MGLTYLDRAGTISGSSPVSVIFLHLFITYQEMAPAVNGTGPTSVEGKFGPTFRF